MCCSGSDGGLEMIWLHSSCIASQLALAMGGMDGKAMYGPLLQIIYRSVQAPVPISPSRAHEATSLSYIALHIWSNLFA